MIISKSANKWNASYNDCLGYPNKKDTTMGIPTVQPVPAAISSTVLDSDTKVRVQEFLYSLYSHYIKVGKDTDLERKVLKHCL